MSIGTKELREGAGHIPRLFRSPVLPTFAVLSAVEMVLIYFLPGQAMLVAETIFGEPDLELLIGALAPAAGATVLTVLGLILISLLRDSLWAPARRIALDDIDLSAGEVFREAASRAPRLFLVQQFIGILVLLLTALTFLIGLSLPIIPTALVTFILSPALYMAVARDKTISGSIVESVRVTRHNVLAVFGVEAAIMVVAMWIGQMLQFLPDDSALADPLALGWAAAAMIVTYRFMEFFGRATLYFALDEAGELD